MADVLKLVTLLRDGTSEGAAVTGGDLNGVDWSLVRDTLRVTPGERKQQFSDSNRRYGGATLSAETHGNGVITASLIYAGTTADAAIAKWEQLLTLLESSTADYYLKWQPQSATYPVYYQIKGPANWQANYRWIEFSQNKSIVFEVSWPIAPLGRGLSAAVTVDTSGAVPKFTPSILGTAPGLLDLRVSQASSGAQVLPWFMASWTSALPTPASGTVAPFGAIKLATNSTTLATGVTTTNLTSAAESTTTLYGTKVTIASPSAGAANACAVTVDIDPTTLQRDDFGGGDLSLEVWARIKLASANPPTVTTSLAPVGGADYGEARYTAEYGSSGKLLTKPNSSTSNWYFYRLGTVAAFVDTMTSGATWRLTVSSTFAATGGGEFALDHLVIVPSHQRALTPSGKSPSNYPAFISVAAAITRVIKSNLSGWTKPGVDTTFNGFFPDSGLGGQLLEVPAAAFNVYVKASAAIPDDPTMATVASPVVDTASAALTIGGWFTPRYYLARGA